MTAAMTPSRSARAALLALALAAVSGCAAVSSLDSASRSLPTFELNPVPAPAGAASGPGAGRILQVDLPTASGAIATDRIAIKPGPLQVAYLPDGRWVDPAPQHVQSLMVRTLANTGRLGFVGGSTTGPLPDYVLLVDLQAFQAEVAPAGTQPPVTAVIRMSLTVVRDIDRRVVASRRFERRVGTTSDDALNVVSAFNAGMDAMLRDVTSWLIAVDAGRAGA
jgi:cholesterol transport system auxiliary component